MRASPVSAVEMEVLNAHLALSGKLGKLGKISMFAVMAVFFPGRKFRRQPLVNTTLRDNVSVVDR